MYNRYIPGSDGRYRCEHVTQTPSQAAQPSQQPQPPEEQKRADVAPPGAHPDGRSPAGRIDTGDLLVLAILALLLLDGEGDELIVLIAAIAFLFF